MESVLLALAQVVLPSEILAHFEIVDITKSSTEIHIHLDEKMDASMSSDSNFEAKGFMPCTSITDFPIRDHKVILKIRRRRWIDKRNGNSFVLPISVAAEGSRYSKEFADFLKVPSPSIGNEIKRTHTPFTPYLCFGEHKSRNAHGA